MAQIDAPLRRERPRSKRPDTIPSSRRIQPISRSTLEALLKIAMEARVRKKLPPLASMAFLTRATFRKREILRVPDGQLMLASLLRNGDAGGPPEGGWFA